MNISLTGSRLCGIESLVIMSSFFQTIKKKYSSLSLYSKLGYVHFTGIWKSLGNSKADIVKMVDSNPELKVKKIRGGFLKIQGTW